MGDEIRADPLYIPILILFLAGAFTKSAQFPFHFWLPNAMAAPTPVSAYLHSATMVKAGVYLMARMNPALGGSRAVVLDAHHRGRHHDRFRKPAGRAPDRHQAGAGLHDADGAGRADAVHRRGVLGCDQGGDDVPRGPFALQGGALPDDRARGPRDRHAGGRPACAAWRAPCR
jgi:hypothetical protein